MRRSARDIAAGIKSLEQAIDLDHPDWSIGDLHLWPIYRMEIYRLLFAQPASSPVDRNRLQRQLRPVWRSGTVSEEARGPHDIWLVSDGISFVRSQQREIERFCTPLYQACRSLGRRAVLVDRSSETPRRVHEPYRWFTPTTQRSKVLGSLLANVVPDRRHERLIHRIETAASQTATPLPRLQARRFDAMARAVLRLAKTVERRMRADRVKAVFVVGYYDVGGYAHMLAARRVGAVSVDVQHGVTGALHMGYADWQVCPRGGLAVLPQVFWTWSEADAAVIAHWALRHLSPPRAVVGGHPFLQAWHSGHIGVDPATAACLERMRGQAAGRPIVLVTLQPNVTSQSDLAPLTDAWRQRPNVAWWLRLHPMALGDRPAFEALLKLHAVDCWDIESASELPLPALLAEASVHATHSSSAVLEAELFGLASIVWSDYGAELFSDALSRGAASLARDGEEFVRLLGNSQHVPVSPGPASDDRMSHALRQVLGEAA